MNSPRPSSDPSINQLVLVRPEPEGQYSAQVVGLPEIRAVAATRAEAIHQVRQVLGAWLAAGQLVSVELSGGQVLSGGNGHTDPNDPLEQEYLEELARLRRDDLDRTLQEYNQECSSSSSTPTT